MTETLFRFHHEVEVRFKDIDVGGHAHHSHALVYFEEARAAYWREVVGRGGGVHDIDYILAEARVRYHARVLWPQTIRVGVRTSRVSGKIFEMEYEVAGAEGERLVSGSTLQVMYDYDEARSVRVPDEIVGAIEAFESGVGEGGQV